MDTEGSKLGGPGLLLVLIVKAMEACIDQLRKNDDVFSVWRLRRHGVRSNAFKRCKAIAYPIDHEKNKGLLGFAALGVTGRAAAKRIKTINSKNTEFRPYGEHS